MLSDLQVEYYWIPQSGDRWTPATTDMDETSSNIAVHIPNHTIHNFFIFLDDEQPLTARVFFFFFQTDLHWANKTWHFCSFISLTHAIGRNLCKHAHKRVKCTACYSKEIFYLSTKWNHYTAVSLDVKGHKTSHFSPYIGCWYGHARCSWGRG